MKISCHSLRKDDLLYQFRIDERLKNQIIQPYRINKDGSLSIVELVPFRMPIEAARAMYARKLADGFKPVKTRGSYIVEEETVNPRETEVVNGRTCTKSGNSYIGIE